MPIANRPGVNANATINGVHTDTPAESWTVTPRPLKGVGRLAGGRYREGWIYASAGRECQPKEIELAIRWESLKHRRQVEELLAQAPPHQVCLWRAELLSYVGNGWRAEFELPWLSAVDAGAWVTDPGMPSGRLIADFSPEVKVGISGAALTFVQKTAVDYAAATPAASEVWFQEGTRLFKVSSPPAAGAIVYAWVVPLLSMIEAAEGEQKQLRAVAYEPHSLRLLEATT